MKEHRHQRIRQRIKQGRMTRNPHLQIKKVSSCREAGFHKLFISGIDRPILFFTGKSLVGRTIIEKNIISEN